MRAGSLFSGVGGLDLGLARAGFEHEFFCESNPWRRTVLAHHWPGVPIYEDVVRVGKPESGDPADRLRETTDSGRGETRSGLSVDLLCGGFPCQDVSVAGRRAGLAGERSGLFHEFARITDAVRPRWILVENVPGLLSSNGGRDFGVVLGTLVDLGYGVAWRILDSRFFGVPQRRRRVFIVGTNVGGDTRDCAERAGQVLAVGTRCERHSQARGEARQDVAVASISVLGTGGPDDNDGQAGRIVTSALVKRYGKGADSDATDALITSPLPAPLSHGSNPNSNAAGRRREDDYNLVAGPLGGGNDGAGRRSEDDLNLVLAPAVRRLTPTECERLQAWPDGWTDPHGTAPDSRRYAAIGDGVTATVAEWIGRRILEVNA